MSALVFAPMASICAAVTAALPESVWKVLFWLITTPPPPFGVIFPEPFGVNISGPFSPTR